MINKAKLPQVLLTFLIVCTLFFSFNMIAAASEHSVNMQDSSERLSADAIEYFNHMPENVDKQLTDLMKRVPADLKGKIVSKKIVSQKVLVDKRNDFELLKKSMNSPQTVYEDEITVQYITTSGDNLEYAMGRKTKTHSLATISTEWAIGAYLDNISSWENYVNVQESYFDWTTDRTYSNYGGYIEKVNIETDSVGKDRDSGISVRAIEDDKTKTFSVSSYSDSLVRDFSNNPYWVYCNDDAPSGVSQSIFDFTFCWYDGSEPYTEQLIRVVGWGNTGV